MKTCIVIPARLGATRLPRKPLLYMYGMPMIIHVIMRGIDARVGPVYVATPDMEIVNMVEFFGYKAVKTGEANTGTDRVLQAVSRLDSPYDLIVNLQGDCPLMERKAIKDTVEALKNNPEFDIATAVIPLKEEDKEKDNIVKAYLGENNECLDFSRKYRGGEAWHHVGLYVYRRDALMKFCRLTQSKREKSESLEQLRALDNRMKIIAAKVNDLGVSVDTPEDFKLANNLIIKKRNETPPC